MRTKVNRRKFMKLAGAGAAAASLGGGIGIRSADAQDARTLTVAWDTDIDTLDPASFKSIGAYTVQANVYDSPMMWKVRAVQETPGLLRSQPNEFDPSVAESWAFEKDESTLVLKIRRGMKFPSGREVTARDVKYLFDRGLQSPGYMRLIFPTLIRVTKPEQFVVRDDYTFAIELPAPSPMTLDMMALANNALLDPEEVKKHATAQDPWATEWLKRNVAGLGPYRLVKNEPGVEVVLEATKGHWRQPGPHFQRVVFKFVPNEADRVLLLKRRAVDIVVGRPGLSPRNVKALEGEQGLKIFSVPDTTCHWLAMNTSKKPFDNVKVRQAVNYAVPVQAIIPNVLYGYGTQMKSPIPALTPGHDANASPYKYDIDRARQLMKEAGVGDSIAVDLAIRVGWQPHEQAATWIQRELEKIGFKVNIVKETDATFRQLASKGDHVLSIESWQSWINDPFYHLFFLFHSKAKATNTAFYSNPALDKIIDEGMHETNKEKRLQMVKEAQKLVIDDAVWGFLWYDNWTRVARADLGGVEKRWDTFERYFNMKLA